MVNKHLDVYKRQLIMTAGGALAEETIILPGKQAGDVKFTHQKHMTMLNNCQPCHSSPEGGEIAGFGKETAHKLCKDCHVDRKAGPTTCSQCHKH